MDPSEIHALILALQNQQTANAWTYVLLAIASAGGAAVAVFGAAYFRKRGEDQAVRENFDAIRGQLRTTTRDTEEIKQFLSGHAWRSQQQWSAREKFYSELLTHLHHFKIALDDLSDYYIEPGSEHMPDDQRGGHFHILLADASAAFTKVQKLLGPAAIFLSSTAVASLRYLINEHYGLANFGALCTADYVKGAHKLVNVAYDRVLDEAKSELGIESE